MKKYRLQVELPFMKKGNIYFFDDETGKIYASEDRQQPNQYSLRNGLTAYLWLLKTEGSRYLRAVK